MPIMPDRHLFGGEAWPSRRRVKTGRQLRLVIAAGQIELPLFKPLGFAKIDTFKSGQKQIGAGEIDRAGEIAASKIGSR